MLERLYSKKIKVPVVGAREDYPYYYQIDKGDGVKTYKSVKRNNKYIIYKEVS